MHPHHELFEAAARGEAEQFEAKHSTWREFESAAVNLAGLYSHPHEWIVQRKQKTHVVNGWEVPAPMVEAPPLGAEFWTEDSSSGSWAFSRIWSGCTYDQRALARSIYHATFEGAVMNCKARHGVDPFAEGTEA